VLAKKDYNDEQRGLRGRTDLISGNNWYRQQAYRAIAQALGRCIRHEKDYGTVILMDSRHCDDDAFSQRDAEGISRVHKELPSWIRPHVKNLAEAPGDGILSKKTLACGWDGMALKMKQFFDDAKAHCSQGSG